MPSPADAQLYSIKRRRAPCRLTLEAGAMLSRGLAEFAPRRISYPKLAATVVRQIAFKASAPFSTAALFMPLGGQDAETTLSHLGDVPELMLGAPIFPGFLDYLSAGSGRRVVAVLGRGETPADDSHAAFAKSLAGYSPLLEQRTAQEFLTRFREANALGTFFPAAFDRDLVVVEERPGKAHALQLEEATIKAQLKKWQNLTARTPGDVTRHAAETADGFGVGALVLGSPDDDKPARSSRRVQFASLDVQFAEEAVGLDTGPRIRELATAWLAEISSVPLTKIRRVVVSAPWLAVAAQIGGAFSVPGGRGPEILYPDQIFGWQPFLSLIFTLYQTDLPALFVYTGRYPEVHFAAVWS